MKPTRDLLINLTLMVTLPNPYLQQRKQGTIVSLMVGRKVVFPSELLRSAFWGALIIVIIEKSVVWMILNKAASVFGLVTSYAHI